MAHNNFLFIGIGLIKKYKPSWYALFVYIFFGSVWLSLGGLLGHIPTNVPGCLIAILTLLINGGMGTAIYFITKPVFISTI